MKSLRWVVAAVAALVMGWSTVASAPVAAAAKTYVKATVGCSYVDVRNVSSTKVAVIYGDPSQDDPDGAFLLAGKKTKRIHTSRMEFVFIVVDSKGERLLQASDILNPQCVTASTPKITGTARVGEKLTASAGSWGPTGVVVTYQWYRSGKKITDATSPEYTLTKFDKGKKITVKVTGALDGYRTVTKTSKATAKVKAGVLVTAVPAVTGSAVVGGTLTADPGTWGPEGVKVTYQWYRGGSKIKGASGTTYTVAKQDVGKKLTFKVTGSLSGYTTKTVASAPTAKVVVAPL
jgi:hypothetical protein